MQTSLPARRPWGARQGVATRTPVHRRQHLPARQIGSPVPLNAEHSSHLVSHTRQLRWSSSSDGARTEKAWSARTSSPGHCVLSRNGGNGRRERPGPP